MAARDIAFRPGALGLLPALILVGCGHSAAPPSQPVDGFRIVEAGFNFGGTPGATILIREVSADARGRVFVQYETPDGSPKRRFRFSADGGSSFGPERDLSLIRGSDAQAAVYPAFASPWLAAFLASRGNLFYTRSDQEGAVWSPPVQINDELGSAVSPVSCVDVGEMIACVWSDRRRGVPLVYFSSSGDLGRTWTRNGVVDYDFREGDQMSPKLVAATGGRLITCWEDYRDRQTLVDIRCSSSGDDGRHWSPSRKINDDQAYAWQAGFDLIADGPRIFAAFGDFRDPGFESDNDWNIYFTRSDDSGARWSKNIRLHDFSAGRDVEPRLGMDARGTLYCAWISNRRSIFGDVLLSYSRDAGRSWSPGTRVSGGDREHYRDAPELVVVAPGRLLCRWRESDYQAVRHRLVQLELSPSSAPAVESAQEAGTRPMAPLKVTPGETLFHDDFAAGDGRWEPAGGAWMTSRGTYVGAEPGNLIFSSFARFAEPKQYVLQGRFMLDPVAHHRASLYLRADPARRTYYVVSNHFRFGAWLGIREERAAYASSLFLDSRPLAQLPFPFRSGVWYQFRLVVTPEQVDYYVEGRRMLSYSGKLRLPPGRIGVGGYSAAPTYFDDVTVSAILPGNP